MNAEQKYCRGPLVKALNATPGFRVYSQTNYAALLAAIRGRLRGRLSERDILSILGPVAQGDSGRPDLCVSVTGMIGWIECKAGFYSLDMSIYEENQRVWAEANEPYAGAGVWIGVWLYSLSRQMAEREAQIRHDKASMFLVPWRVWLETEALSGGARVRYMGERQLSLSALWDRYRLPFVHGVYTIPDNHPIRGNQR